MTLLKKVDVILLVGISLAAIAVLVADYAGLAGGSLINRLGPEKLLLVLLATIGLHLGVAHLSRERLHESLDATERRISEEFTKTVAALVTNMRGVDVKVFHDAAEEELYLAARISVAQSEVCDLTWKEKMSDRSGLPQRVRTHKTYEETLAKAAKRIPYREVFVFSDPRRKEKLKRRLDENCAGYSCRYFPAPGPVPRLQFVIIDGEEVVFASSSYPALCAIRQRELCAILRAYFEAVWAAATPLKEGEHVYAEEVTKVLSSTEGDPSRQEARRGS